MKKPTMGVAREGGRERLNYKAVFPNVPVAPGIEMAISCPSSRYYVTQLPVLNLSVKIGLKKGMVYETGKFFKNITLWRNINNSRGGFSTSLAMLPWQPPLCCSHNKHQCSFNSDPMVKTCRTLKSHKFAQKRAIFCQKLFSSYCDIGAGLENIKIHRTSDLPHFMMAISFFGLYKSKSPYSISALFKRWFWFEGAGRTIPTMLQWDSELLHNFTSLFPLCTQNPPLATQPDSFLSFFPLAFRLWLTQFCSSRGSRIEEAQNQEGWTPCDSSQRTGFPPQQLDKYMKSILGMTHSEATPWKDQVNSCFCVRYSCLDNIFYNLSLRKLNGK
ncbi:hypothetical protein EK904_007300 [Melospiza melodia maxima]|nr:hypothetical protein EK904_007300 [Melospiza melodia maxima]